MPAPSLTPNVCKKCGQARRDPRSGRCLPCYENYKTRNIETIRAKARARMAWRREMGLAPAQRPITELSKAVADAKRAAERARYRRCRERVLAKVARYRQRHPDRVRTRNINQKAKRRNVPGRHTTAEWTAVLSSYHGLCVYCYGAATTRDHVVAIAAGGDNTIGNLAPACMTCNASKGDEPLVKWMVRRAR